MDRKAVILAYDSYILSEQAEEKKEFHYSKIEDVLEILRILSKDFRKEVFGGVEIDFIIGRLFPRNQEDPLLVYNLLLQAERQGKVILNDKGWRLAPSEKDKE